MTRSNSPYKLSQLRIHLIEHYTTLEIETMAFDLNIDHERLPSKTKDELALSLVEHLQRRNRLDELVTLLRQADEGLFEARFGSVRLGSDEADVEAPTAAVDTTGIRWVEIGVGEFWLGSDNHKDNEKPAHRHHLPTFWIAETPITNAQWQTYVDDTGAAPPVHWRGGRPPAGKEIHPVVHVSLSQALEYCRWASSCHGVAIVLPSEAEWEKAARGEQDARDYPWGDAVDIARANTWESSLEDTTAVTRYSQGKSPYQLLDMSGNVAEWTLTRWGGSYPYDAGGDRESTENPNDNYVIRGGGYRYKADYARVSYRRFINGSKAFEDLGFRVVKHRDAPTGSNWATKADSPIEGGGEQDDSRDLEAITSMASTKQPVRPFPKEDFDKLVGILTGIREFRRASSRYEFVETAFLDSPREKDIVSRLDLDGRPQTVAVRLIRFLIDFGQDQPDRETLGLLLNAMLDEMGGGDSATFIRELFEKYALGIDPIA